MIPDPTDAAPRRQGLKPARFAQFARFALACAAWLLLAAPATAATPPPSKPDGFAPAPVSWLPIVPPYQIDTWETEQGLPENSATAMVQSGDGYLWFGTFNGLVRFDGFDFTVLNPVNTPQLPSAAIVNLHQDRTGRLWISTDRGLVTLAQGHWRAYGTNEGWAGNHVRTFAERPDGGLLFTTFDGRIVEFANDRLQPLPTPPGETGRGYFAHGDEDGHWWVVQNRFIGKWDAGRWIETIPTRDAYADSVGAGTARDGSLLLVVDDELQRWRRGSLAASVRLPGRPGGIWAVSEDSAGDVWICTYTKGVCRVRPDGTFSRWNTTNGLAHNSTRFAFEDRERNLWIGSSGGGLTRFKPRRFQVIGRESGLGEPISRSVWPDAGGGLWVATYGHGLYRLGARGMEHVPLPDFASSTVYSQCVLQDRAGTTWVGALAQGAWHRDGHGTRRIPAAELGSRTLFSLFEDSKGRVWFGGDRALAVRENGAIRVLATSSGSPLPGVVGMAELPNGHLWFSNREGVFEWNGSHLAETFLEPGRPARDILCFLPDPDGSVWLGSQIEGLLQWRSGRLRRLDASAGFPTTGVNAILEDNHGHFWMPSRQGIVRANRAELEAVAAGTASRATCHLLDSSDGLVSVDCPGGYQPVCAKDREGRLWFATQKGIATIDPAAFRPNTQPPPVRVESLAFWEPPPGGDANRGPP